VDTPRYSQPARRSSLLAAALATWAGYAVPLTALSALALAPAVLAAARAPAPVDQATAAATLFRGWAQLAWSWLGQLMLVGGAAAIVRDRPSQRRAFVGGLIGLGRAIVPCLAAAAAVLVASLALAIPGLIVLVLFALTAASPARGVAASLLDASCAARTRLPAVALSVAAMLALDAAIGLGCYAWFVLPLVKHPTAAQLIGARSFVRAVAIALVFVSPLPATLLALIRHRARRPADGLVIPHNSSTGGH